MISWHLAARRLTRSTCLRWIGTAVVALAIAREGCGMDLVFSGSLEKVTPEAISILLPDGIIIDAQLPKTGPLSAKRLSDGRSVGDLVELTCETISPRYDEQAELLRYLELKSLKPSRVRLTADLLTKAMTSRVWTESGNLLKPPANSALPRLPGSSGPTTGEAAAVLERARSVNLALARDLPNFVADEAVKRFRLIGGNSAASLPFDTFLSEISVQGSREVRQRIMRNGSLWTQPFAEIPGFRWFAGFGTQLNPLFLPACPTVFEFEGRQEMNGKEVWVFRFRAQADGCFGYLYSQYQRHYPELTGRVFINGATGNMVRYEQSAVNLPAAFLFQQMEKQIVWEERRIGEASYMLPVSARFLARFSNGDPWTVEVEYRNHRHFEASSKLIFGEPVP